MNPAVLCFAGAGQGSSILIYAGVLDLPFDGIDAIAENALHPFIEEQTRTVDKLVDHPRGEVVRKRFRVAA